MTVYLIADLLVYNSLSLEICCYGSCTIVVSPANEFTLSPGDGGYRERVSSFASTTSGRRSPADDLLDPKVGERTSQCQLRVIQSLD